MRPTRPRHRSTVRTLALALALAVGLGACAGDDTVAPADLEAADVWARSTPNGLGAVYLRLTSGEADTLIAASVDPSIAGAVEIHEVVEGDGGMMMRELEGGLPIATGETVVLEPGGYHLMMLDMPEMHAPGTTFDVTLEFASGASLTVTAEVRETATAMEGMEGHGGMGS